MKKAAALPLRFLLVLILLSINCASSSSISENIDITDPNIIIDRVIEAYGGSALDSIRSFKMEGSITQGYCYESSLSDKVPLLRVYMQPDDAMVEHKCPKQRKWVFFIDENYEDTEETYSGAIIDGDLDSWDSGIGSYEGAERATFTLPWFLNKYRKKIVKEKVDENDNNFIVLSYGQGWYWFYIDTRDYRIRKFQHYAGSGTFLRKSTIFFDDFRAVQGVQFPHQEEHHVASDGDDEPGHRFGTVIIDKIKVNSDIDPDIFHPSEKELEEMRRRKEEYRKSR